MNKATAKILHRYAIAAELPLAMVKRLLHRTPRHVRRYLLTDMDTVVLRYLSDKRPVDDPVADYVRGIDNSIYRPKMTLPKPRTNHPRRRAGFTRKVRKLSQRTLKALGLVAPVPPEPADTNNGEDDAAATS